MSVTLRQQQQHRHQQQRHQQQQLGDEEKAAKYHVPMKLSMFFGCLCMYVLFSIFKSTRSLTQYSSSNSSSNTMMGRMRMDDQAPQQPHNSGTSSVSPLLLSQHQQSPDQSYEQQQLLLTVPFYIYKEFDWLDDDNVTTTMIRNPTTIKWSNYTFREYSSWDAHERYEEIGLPAKEDSELMFYLSAAKNPRRVHNPEEAQLFLVPLFSVQIGWKMMYHYKVPFICKNNRCDEQLLEYANNVVLAESTWFQRSNGTDHITTMASFFWPFFTEQGTRYPNLRNCNALLAEQAEQSSAQHQHLFINRNRIGFNTFYVSEGCAPIVPFHNKTDDFILVASLRQGTRKKKKDKKYTRKDKKNTQDRRDICNWISTSSSSSSSSSNKNITTSATTNQQQQHNHNHSHNHTTNNISINKNNNNTNQYSYKMSICGETKIKNNGHCPALAYSKTGFHTRGDTYGSQRLFDTLLSGTVPIFTTKEQYNVHQSFIDWNQLVYYLQLGGGMMGDNYGTGTTITTFRGPAATQESFLVQIQDIVNDPQLLEEKTRNVVSNQDLFDWSTLIPFDTYMYMFQAHIYPKTRIPVNSSRYSALILPPPLP